MGGVEQPVNPLLADELALIVDDKRKRYLVRLFHGGQFHFHNGVVKHDDLIGRDEGVRAETSLGRYVWGYRPRMRDYLLGMPRSSAIIYPKDIAFLLLWADIFPGARVFESGLGSGALAIGLLRAIGPPGRLVTYEARTDMVERATSNVVAFLGECPNWVVRTRDVYEGIDDGPFDRVVLDLPDPGALADEVLRVLVTGGMLCSYVPNITQVQASVTAYEATHQCSEIQSFETLFRPWEFRGATARPVHSMVSHTGFMTFARKGPPPRAAEKEALGLDEADAVGEPIED